MEDQGNADIQGFDDPPRAKTGSGKKWLMAGVALAVLVGGVGLAAPMFLDQAKYKDLIKEKVTSATGYSVDWQGDVAISLLPLPSVALDELTLKNGSVQIASFKSAEVNIALMPLLSKKVEVTSVELVEPDVSLVIDKSGKPNWMTDKLSKQSDGKSDADTGSSGQSETKSTAPQVSVDSLKIIGGKLKFKNEQAGGTQEIENLNAQLRAETLTGPYALKGDVAYTGKKIEFDVKAGKLDGNQNSYPLNAKINFPELKLNAEYAGVVAAPAPLKLDGEFTLAADDLANTVSAFSGSKPNLPDGIGGELQLKTNLFYDGQEARLDTLRLAVGDLAYTGEVAVKKLGSEAPPLTVDLKPESGAAGDAKDGIVAVLKDLSLKGTGTFANNRVAIDDGHIALKDQKVAVSGTYALAETGKRPKIDMTIKANKLDVDSLMGALAGKTAAKPQAKENDAAPTEETVIEVPARGFALPFDGKLNAEIGSLVSGGKTYAPVNANIVSSGNALTIKNLDVGLPAKAKLSANGKVGKLAALSDFDINGSLQMADAEAFAQTMNVTLPQMSQKIGALSVNSTLKGSLDKIAFNGSLSALKFDLSGKGTVTTPLDGPAVSGLQFAVKHPSLIGAIQTFQPTFAGNTTLRGPLDLSGMINWEDKSYKLTGLKGTLGSTTAEGNIALNAGGAKPEVSGDLAFGDLVFDATKSSGSTPANSAAGGKKAAAAPASSTARWSGEAIDTSWMNSFNADLDIKARSITQDLWKLNNANLSFVLQDGKLTVSDMSAAMFGGQVALSGNVKSGVKKGDPLAMALAMNASNVDAQKLQSALTSKPSDTVQGIIQKFKVDIASNGASPSALVNALNGQGEMSGKDLIIKGIDAAQLAETAKGSFKPLERAGSLYSTFQSGQTQFDNFISTFGIQSGVVNFTQMEFDGAKANITGVGQVNLPRWTIDMKNTITVKGTDIPPFDITIRGPLDSPLQTGGSIIEQYLRQKAQKKIEKLIGKELEKRFGIPLGQDSNAVPAEQVPASGDGGVTATDPQAQPEPKPLKPKDAAKKAVEEEAVKALQGLFGGR